MSKLQSKTIFAFAVMVGVLSLAGCSSKPRVPEYQCPLRNATSCASMLEVLDASQKADPKAKVQSVFDPAAQVQNKGNSANSQPFYGNQGSSVGQAPSGYAGTSAPNGQPVWNQPKTHRIWLAPYVDADGVLRSDQYTYTTTPGSWNYGEMKKSGAASGIFEPQRPMNKGGKLGFKIDPNNGQAGQSAAVKKDPAPAPTPTPNNGNQPSSTTVKGGSGNGDITQPALRFNQP